MASCLLSQMEESRASPRPTLYGTRYVFKVRDRKGHTNGLFMLVTPNELNAQILRKGRHSDLYLLIRLLKLAALTIATNFELIPLLLPINSTLYEPHASTHLSPSPFFKPAQKQVAVTKTNV